LRDERATYDEPWRGQRATYKACAVS
jgi:hypothetical protein